MRATRCGVRFAMIGAVLMMAPIIADCQQYGQWTWDGFIGAEGRSNDNFSEGRAISGYTTRALFVGLGVNGFIIHPAVARFRLSLDTWYTQFSEGGAEDSVRFSGRFDLGLFERSAHPIRLYFGRAQYDYQDMTSDDPITLLGGLPDTTTNWGGRLRFRRGILRGLLVGLDSSELNFLSSDRRPESSDRYFADWARSGGKIQHHVRLVHEVRDYSRLNFAFETSTLTWDEHGPLSPAWRWDLSAVGIRRTTKLEDADATDMDTARLRSQFIRDQAGGNSLNLSYGFGYASSGGAGSAVDHLLEGRYRMLMGSGWEVSPFAALTLREIGEGDISNVQGGLSLIWTGAAGAWDATFSGQGAYGQSRFSLTEETSSQVFWSASGASVLGHGTPAGLRKELQIAFSRNEIRSVGDGDADLPDLGIGFAAAGAQDTARVRFSLFHDVAGGQISGWGEWRRRKADSLFDEIRLRAEDYLATAQLRWRRLSVVFNGGTTEIDDFQSTNQVLTYYGGAVTWSPWRSVHATASYREDFRRLSLAPDIDSDRFEGTIEFQMGHLFLRGEIFQYTERPENGLERKNRGIFWSVRRGFAGWLPFVTGPQRRGVIR